MACLRVNTRQRTMPWVDTEFATWRGRALPCVCAHTHMCVRAGERRASVSVLIRVWELTCGCGRESARERERCTREREGYTKRERLCAHLSVRASVRERRCAAGSG